MAFNAGYTMQQYDPELVEKLLSTDNDNEIAQALTQGAKQSHKDKIFQQQQARKERNQTKLKGR